MPKYMLAGKDHRDRKVTEFVEASSADEAVRSFAARGYTDVELHSDEVVAHLFTEGNLQHFSPRDYLAIGRVSRLGYLWRMIVLRFRKQWFVSAILIAIIVGRRMLEAPWDFVDSLAAVLLFNPLIIEVLGELFSASRRFERAMAYNAWARWEKMLSTISGLRRSIPEPHFSFFQAKALAGMGRIDEAMDLVRPFADDQSTPAWLYWAQLADVFHAAKLGDRAIECSEKALEHAPDNVTIMVDLAMSHLRYHRDTEHARPLLERAKQHAISDMIRPFFIMSEGVLALEENRPAQARTLLEESLRMATPFRHATPLVGAAVDRIHMYLALACAATGDHATAQAHYSIAEPRLQAFEAHDLLDRCHAALGKR